MEIRSVYPAVVTNDMEKTVAFYSQLLGIKFYRAVNNVANIEVAINGRAGLEILRPLPGGNETAVNKKIRQFIDRHGDGSILGMVVKVDDAEAALLKAKSMGMDGSWAGHDPAEINQLSKGKVNAVDVKECFLDSDVTGNIWILFLQDK